MHPGTYKAGETQHARSRQLSVSRSAPKCTDTALHCRCTNAPTTEQAAPHTLTPHQTNWPCTPVEHAKSLSMNPTCIALPNCRPVQTLRLCCRIILIRIIALRGEVGISDPWWVVARRRLTLWCLLALRMRLCVRAYGSRVMHGGASSHVGFHTTAPLPTATQVCCSSAHPFILNHRLTRQYRDPRQATHAYPPDSSFARRTTALRHLRKPAAGERIPSSTPPKHLKHLRQHPTILSL